MEVYRYPICLHDMQRDDNCTFICHSQGHILTGLTFKRKSELIIYVHMVEIPEYRSDDNWW